MIKKSTALAVVLALLCFSCHENGDATADDISSLNKETNKTDFQLADTVHFPQGTEETKTDNTTKESLPSQQIDWDKKIVKTAALEGEVKDFQSFSLQLHDRIQKFGGYISQEEQSQSDYKIENSVVLKVPVYQFDNLLNELAKSVNKVDGKSITSEDVTTQVVDGRSRLEAKKQVRLRYLELLKQAKNMEEILDVQKEINDIQEQIEMVSGRVDLLNHASAMSTINFKFYQVLDAAAGVKDQKDPTFFAKVKTAFANGWYWISEVFVGLISIWPLAAMIIAGLFLLRRKRLPTSK
jgi:hypothetical protein